MTVELIKSFIIAFIGAGAGALFAYIVTIPKKRKENNALIDDRLAKTEEGIKSLLRSEIQKEYLKICNPNRQYAKPYEKENVAKLFAAYTDMGGNSYVAELFEQIMHKPVEPEYKNHSDYRN